MKNIFFLFLFCCITNIVSAQPNYFPIEHYEIKPFKINTLLLISDLSTFSISSVSIMNSNNSMNVSAYNYDDLAIFCKLEVKMEKASGFPVKFRLGEVNYVEQMEGKPYSIFY
ncbi:MAG: hypothetical protein AB8G11_26045 [Saprospiraceae bacterium]